MKHITPETDFAFTDGAFSLRGEVAIQEPMAPKPHIAEQTSFPACHHYRHILRAGGYECEDCGLPMSEQHRVESEAQS